MSRSHLHTSDLIPTGNTCMPQIYTTHFQTYKDNSSPQNPTGPELGPKSLGTNDSKPTFDTTKFYPGEIPFRNQGMSPSPPQHVEPVGAQTTPVNTPRGISGT